MDSISWTISTPQTPLLGHCQTLWRPFATYCHHTSRSQPPTNKHYASVNTGNSPAATPQVEPQSMR